MDHQARHFAPTRIASRSLQCSRNPATEKIFAQEEEWEYPDYQGKIKAALCSGRDGVRDRSLARFGRLWRRVISQGSKARHSGALCGGGQLTEMSSETAPCR
jgi:hypothetical protein